MPKKKRAKSEDHVDESWLIPYADMLTLLLALFIVLFAMSEVDAQKYEQLSQIFKSEFSGGQNIFEHQSSQIEPIVMHKEKLDIEEDEIAEDLAQAELNYMVELQEKINQYIQENNLSDVLKTDLSDEGLMISILNDVYFDSGKAEINESGVEIAQEMAEFLYSDPPHQIVVSGHTDNIPISNSTFDSNWDLSVARAVNFMSLLLENDRLDPTIFSAKGYGEHKPLASNDTKEDRELNRRVEVLILPNYEFDLEDVQ